MSNYIIVSSVRNEAVFIEKTISSVINQEVLPLRWCIVDDGSTDGTAEIIKKYTKTFSWIIIISVPDRGFNKLGGNIVERFYRGFELLKDLPWDFLVKLDCDLQFDKSYFSAIFQEFAREPKLGMASGQTYSIIGKRTIWEDAPLDHVRGCSKIYRRECFDEINGLVRSLGWDTIDEVRARMLGWKTQSFPDLELIHLRPIASKDGVLHGNIRHGHIAYLTGSHPLYFFLRCVYRLFYQPYFFGAVFLFYGYLRDWLLRKELIVNEDLLLFYRKEQLGKISHFAFIRAYLKRFLVH